MMGVATHRSTWLERGTDAEPRSEHVDEVSDRPADSAPTDDAGIDAEVMREAGDRGQLADEAGGSVAAVTRVADESC
jgi:hypothetical protein